MRVEDDVLVTEAGHENLTLALPTARMRLLSGALMAIPGSGALVRALAALIEGKLGGRFRLGTEVTEITAQDGRATGVRFADGTHLHEDFAEALSVIVQVIVFKRFRRRVFLMTPVHHHFEMAAWSETKIIVRFWLIAAVFAARSGWPRYSHASAVLPRSMTAWGE